VGDFRAYPQPTPTSLINDKKDNCAFPPLAVLAAMTGVHVRHVARAISGLKAKGLLIVAKAGNSRYANHYQVNVAAVLSTSGASTGDAATRLEGLQDSLYGHIRAACAGASPAPAEVAQATPEEVAKEQLSGSEAQAKLPAKLLAKKPAGRCASARRPPATRDTPPGGQEMEMPTPTRPDPYARFNSRKATP
jgi:hypothetical protein